jgi:hypothetical protein
LLDAARKNAHLSNALVHIHVVVHGIDFIYSQLKYPSLAFFARGLLARRVESALRLDGGLLDLDENLVE